MGLSTRINDVSVKASRGPYGYLFNLQDVLKAADVPEGMASKITGLYRDSGHAARPGYSRLWFVGVGEIMDYVFWMRRGLPKCASEMTESQLGVSAAMDRLEECAAACYSWASSRRIPGWGPSGTDPCDPDWGVVVDGVLIRAARPADGAWFFEPSGMLRAAGMPEDGASELIEAGRASGHAAECRLPGTSGPVWMVDVEGCRDFAARGREAARAGLDVAIRRDGATEALDKLDETEDALCRLEECIAECGRWIASLEDRSEGETGGCASSRGGEGIEPAGWDSSRVNPYDRPGLVPEEAAAAADALLDRLPMLCRAFGISQFMDRERQLARIIWLMAFRGEPVDCPADGTAEAAFLWRGMGRRDVRELVGSAMAD